jgi:hypothetical protein
VLEHSRRGLNYDASAKQARQLSRDRNRDRRRIAICDGKAHTQMRTISQSLGPWVEPHRRPQLPISSDYHCLQARTLLQLARKTNSTDTAKALLKLAGEYIELAEEMVRLSQHRGVA